MSESLVKVDCTAEFCVQYSFEFLHLPLALSNPVRYVGNVRFHGGLVVLEAFQGVIVRDVKE